MQAAIFFIEKTIEQRLLLAFIHYRIYLGFRPGDFVDPNDIKIHLCLSSSLSKSMQILQIIRIYANFLHIKATWARVSPRGGCAYAWVGL